MAELNEDAKRKVLFRFITKGDKMKIYLYISHCENTILKGEVLTSGLIEKVFTTDSLLTETNEKIEVIENE